MCLLAQRKISKWLEAASCHLAYNLHILQLNVQYIHGPILKLDKWKQKTKIDNYMHKNIAITIKTVFIISRCNQTEQHNNVITTKIYFFFIINETIGCANIEALQRL